MRAVLSAPEPAAFRGPRIIVAALLSAAISLGCTLGIFGVFLGPLAEEFAAPKAQLALGNSLWQAAMGLGAPVVGWLLVRYSVRTFMAVGGCLLGVGLAAVSRAEPLWLVGVFYFAAGIGSVLCGPLPSWTIVANWYIERRGRALGIAMNGSTIGMALMPVLAASLIGWLGWRDAMLWIGVGATGVIVPVVLRWVVLRPEHVGQGPDGSTPTQSLPAQADEHRPLPTGQVLRDRRFQLIAGIYACCFGASTALLVFIVSFATSLGLALQSGALMLSVRALSTVVGRTLCGELADRMDNRLLLGLVVTGYGALWLTLSYADSIGFLFVAALAMGFFEGALGPLQGSIIGKVFGRHVFSQVLGLKSGAMLPVNLSAPPLFGLLLDISGDDYGFAFRCFLGLFAVALVLVFFLRIPEHGPDDNASPAAPPQRHSSG
jgi:MFS family permease